MASRETSKEAYNHLKNSGVLGLRQSQVFEAIKQIGPATAAEIAEHDKASFSNPASGDNCRARLFELRKMGFVEEVGKRVCSISGRNVILWVVSQNKVEKPKKSPKKHILSTLQDTIAAVQKTISKPISSERKLKEIALVLRENLEKLNG